MISLKICSRLKNLVGEYTDHLKSNIKRITEYQFNVGKHKELPTILSLNNLDNTIDDLHNAVRNTHNVNQSLKQVESALEPILTATYETDDKTTATFHKKMLATIADVDKEFVGGQFRQELEHYKQKRQKEAALQNKSLKESYLTRFFCINFGSSGKTKVNAANKMIKALNGQEPEFKNEEIYALRNSRLGKIVQKYEDLGVLPKTFQQQEQRHIEKFIDRAFLRP